MESIEPSIERVSWDEDSYGIFKRWIVFRAWVEAHAKRRDLSRLRVLDYGCGTGALVAYPLALLGHTVLGSDIHDPSIALARARYQLPNLSFTALSVEALLKQPDRFDVVICSEVLEHLASPDDFLLSLRRLTVPNGILIITTPNGYGSYELCCSLERGFKRCGVDQWVRKVHQLLRPSFHRHVHGENDEQQGRGTMGYLNVDSGHIQFFRRRNLEQLFHGAGLVVVERRARTLLCGPYLDQLLTRLPFRHLLYRFNGRLADSLPFSWAADWMFLLERRETSARER